MNGSILDWEGWRAIEVLVLVIALPAIAWLWSKLDGIRAEAESKAKSEATAVMSAVQAMKSDADKVHSDLWKAIHELGQEQLTQLKKQHEHELWARDHFIDKDTLNGGLESLKEVLGARMDAFSDQLDANTAALNHLMAAQTRKGR